MGLGKDLEELVLEKIQEYNSHHTQERGFLDYLDLQELYEKALSPNH